jgi:hypothetical protein
MHYSTKPWGMIQSLPLKDIRSRGSLLFFLPLETQAQLPEQDCNGSIVVTSYMMKAIMLPLFLLIAHITFAQENTIKKQEEVIPIKVVDSLYLRGQIDAFKFYHNYRDAGTITLVASLISPISGLVPAIVFSEIPPKPTNLNCPNIELFTTSVPYYRGYTDRARKIKNGRVWKSWLIGLGVNTTLAVLVIVARS